MFSVGIGITDACNYNCRHCYSRTGKPPLYFNFEHFKRLLENNTIESINFGTGESACHDDFRKFFHFSADNHIKTCLTSNGYSVNLLTDDELKLFNDIDFSLDFASSHEHDKFRGRGAFKNVVKGIQRCKNLGVECSIVFTAMACNYKAVKDLTRLAKELVVNLRINIYKPVNTTKHNLSYSQFWYLIKYLVDHTRFIACSEPIVNTVLKNARKGDGIPCGKASVRIKPSGQLVPCVYLGASNVSLPDVGFVIPSRIEGYEDFHTFLPEFCADCEKRKICNGGCASRRYYLGGLNTADPYCPYRNDEDFTLECTWADKVDLVHANYLCTLIVK
ncbi:MAG: radical SAM protein [Candidatus Aminicenantes bacterium]|nr:MAG: radical SAM protein [Candidatus Aminicenantes bacterium]